MSGFPPQPTRRFAADEVAPKGALFLWRAAARRPQDLRRVADDEAIAGDVCIPNIGPRQRRIRLVSGIIGIALGFVGLAVLVAFDASPWVRLALFLPFVGGTTGYFQAREKT